MSRHLGTLALALLVTVTACNFGVDFWQSESVTVDVPSAPTDTFTSGLNVNLDKNASTSQIPMLQKIEIPDVHVLVSNVGSDNAATTLSGSLVITDPTDPTFAPLSIPYGSVPISNATDVVVTPNPSDAARFTKMVEAKHAFHIDYTSTVDAFPAQFELTAKIHMVAIVGT